MSSEAPIELKTSLAFEERKQAAIVGWCLRDKLFCMQAERAIKSEWFASTAMGEVFSAVMALYNKYRRVPNPMEVKGFKEFEKKSARQQEKIVEALTTALKQSEIYKLDMLRDEMTDWMHATIFAQGMSKARDVYNAGKPRDAWQIVDDALLLRSTSSFEDGTIEGFIPAQERLKNEREEREAEAAHIIPYGNSFLDESLGGMPQTDVILLGAKTGAGKTQMATSIALKACASGKKVHYFALEAEAKEIERRVKYAMVSAAYYADPKRQPKVKYAISYNNWRKFRLHDLLGKYEEQVQPEVDRQLGGLTTLYRLAGDFDLKALEKHLLKIVGETDLIVIDHLHYIDTGEDENAEYKRVIKIVRDVALKYRVPIIVIAHLRKNQVQRNPPLLPNIEDFMGTSNVPKVATTAIIMGRQPNRRPKDVGELVGQPQITAPPKRHVSPTFVHVVKCRLDGEVMRYTALMGFDRHTCGYEQGYKLGLLVSGGTEWAPLARDEWPDWAESAVDASSEDVFVAG